jgi:transposase
LTLLTDIHGWLATKVSDLSAIVRVGLESGAMSNWLYTDLTKLGLPMICLETFQAHQFLKRNRNKNVVSDVRRGLGRDARTTFLIVDAQSVRTRTQPNKKALMAAS